MNCSMDIEKKMKMFNIIKLMFFLIDKLVSNNEKLYKI